jgi:hypothetical protein
MLPDPDGIDQHWNRSHDEKSVKKKGVERGGRHWIMETSIEQDEGKLLVHITQRLQQIPDRDTLVLGEGALARI